MSKPKVRLLLFAIIGILLMVARAHAQPDRSTLGVDQGIVVESIGKNSEAEKAGLQPGDIILSWSRGEDKGSIGSPFDLWLLTVDQSLRGRVTLKGRRGSEDKTWILGLDVWVIQPEPNLSGPLHFLYRECEQLATAGSAEQIIECWQRVSHQPPGSPAAFAPGIEPWFWLRAAQISAKAKRWETADALYSKAVSAARKTDPMATAFILCMWADTFQSRNQWGQAKERLDDALEQSEKAGIRSLAAICLLGLGIIAQERGELPAATKYFERALSAAEETAPGSLQVAAALNNLGIVSQYGDELAKAEDYYGRALAIREKFIPGSQRVGDSYQNLGEVAERRGNLQKADEYYRSALEIAERFHPGGLDVASALNELGVVALDRDNLIQAEQYFRRSLAIAEKAEPGGLVAMASLVNLGTVAETRGDLNQAESYLRQALAGYRKFVPDSLYVGSTLYQLGAVTQQRGDLAKAEEFLRQAEGIYGAIAPDSLYLATTRSALGEIECARGNLKDAERYYAKSLPIAEKIAPNGLEVEKDFGGLGDIAVKRGDLAAAEQFRRKALGIAEKVVPGSLSHIASLAALADVLRQKQQLNAASELYSQALNALESQMTRMGGSEEVRARFRARQAKIYNNFIDLLMARHQPEIAFETMERSRSRTLLELLAASHADIHKGADPELQRQERNLQELLRATSERRIRLLSANHTEEQAAALEKEIARLQDQYHEVESQLRLSSPDYSALTQPQPLSVAEIQHLLDDNTLLLEYSLGETQSYVWAVTPQSVHAYPLVKEAEIEPAARRVYKLLTVRKHRVKGESEVQREARWAKADAEYPRAAAALSHLVLAPAANELQDKRLLIASDGALNYVPFAALPEPGPRRGQPLIAKHEIVSLPSAAVLAVLRREQEGRKPAPHQVAVLADPVFDANDPRVTNGHTQRPNYEATRSAAQVAESSFENRLLSRSLSDVTGGDRLTRLLFSRQEAEAILAVVPKVEQLRALDFRASRATALNPDLGRYRIIHFATHGLVDSENPELSGLVLSLVDNRGKPQDGFLSLQDVYNLDLQADLVVLSACRTALGKQIKGEGLMGLTRGFMYAGAARVVASLWDVSDVATAKLMGRFYAEMERHGLSPAAALRQAQVSMWKQPSWSPPYYWAAFQIQGEWK